MHGPLNVRDVPVLSYINSKLFDLLAAAPYVRPLYRAVLQIRVR